MTIFANGQYLKRAYSTILVRHTGPMRNVVGNCAKDLSSI